MSRHGHRGYIASRQIRGMDWPQHVQNLVVRDYAQRNGLAYLLSATEYAMPACYMMLETVLAELPRLNGVIAFSLFMMPAVPARRREVYRRVLDAGADLHFALENLALRDDAGIARVEDIFLVSDLVAAAAPPGAGLTGVA